MRKGKKVMQTVFQEVKNCTVFACFWRFFLSREKRPLFPLSRRFFVRFFWPFFPSLFGQLSRKNRIFFMLIFCLVAECFKEEEKITIGAPFCPFDEKLWAFVLHYKRSTASAARWWKYYSLAQKTRNSKSCIGWNRVSKNSTELPGQVAAPEIDERRGQKRKKEREVGEEKEGPSFLLFKKVPSIQVGAKGEGGGSFTKEKANKISSLLFKKKTKFYSQNRPSFCLKKGLEKDGQNTEKCTTQ